MSHRFNIPVFDLLISLSNAVDSVDSSVSNHHFRVAFIAHQIAASFGLPREERVDILIAGIVHDIGALSFSERRDLLRFDADNTCRHAIAGYYLLKSFPPFEQVARLVRYHHHPWRDGLGAHCGEESVPVGSHVLHLADRIDAAIEPDRFILTQVGEVVHRMRSNAGTQFMPRLVDAFYREAERESFWLSLVTPGLEGRLSTLAHSPPLDMGIDGLLSLTRLFSHLIDFRSRFTSTHSSGVARCAAEIAQRMGFSESERKLMEVAGHLHDLGKLILPKEILEKPGKLEPDEIFKVKSHAYYTRHILETIRDLQHVTDWASHHHERLDGEGYCFRLAERDLSLGSRILAVADVFTALTEDRPYREGMKVEQALGIITKMVEQRALDGQVVRLLQQDLPHIDRARVEAQQEAVEAYSDFTDGVERLVIAVQSSLRDGSACLAPNT